MKPQRHIIRLISTILFTSFISNVSFSQVVINEYSASNLKNIKDNYNKTEDWIELYNKSDSDIDISGWHLSDKKKKPGKWRIPDNTIIPAKGFLVFWCSGRDEYKNGHYHTNFKLSQTTGKDLVILSDISKQVLEKLDMKITLQEHSVCRSEDGAETWNICTQPTIGKSNNGSKQYKRYTSAPSINKEAGFYTDKVTVSIINNEANSVLRYTTDGSEVTHNSAIYENPIEINKSTVIKARAFSNESDILPGKMAFGTFFINENDFTLPVISIASATVEELAKGKKDLRPVGSLEYFGKNKKRLATSYGEMNKHGQDSWKLPHRSIDWISRDEMGYSKAIKYPLFSYSGRDKYQKVILRNSGDDNYPAIDDAEHKGSTHIRDEYVQTLAQEGGMHLDIRAVERVIVFLNGKYWGLYGLREKPVDNDYTKEYYDQSKYDLHFLTTWRTTRARYGDEEAFNDWYDIRDFILENDMNNKNNYQHVKDNLDVLSLIDYIIANMNTVAKDWLNYNTGWWRGLNPEGTHKKWAYLLWDLDATFGYYVNYTGIPDESPHAKPCDIYDISKSIDVFFNNDSQDSIDAKTCNSIINGSCPHPATDTTFNLVIHEVEECCLWNWNSSCEAIYDYHIDNQQVCKSIETGSSPHHMNDRAFVKTIYFQPECCTGNWTQSCEEDYNFYKSIFPVDSNEVLGNVGKHEKIFIKLLEENPDFKQLYLSRYADLMNTVYSCENMNNTFDRMYNEILPEMPRQIKRWGGSMEQWNNNINTLRKFINDRCDYIPKGLTECFDVTGPFNVVFISQPADIGIIKLNTITRTALPWTAKYYGNMKNNISAVVKNEYKDKYRFSHWQSKQGNIITPDIYSQTASLSLNKNDTLIAVFEKTNGSEEVANNEYITVSPNPVYDNLDIAFPAHDSEDIQLQLYNNMGVKILELNDIKAIKHHDTNHYTLNLLKYKLSDGVYIIKLNVDNKIYNTKIVLLKIK